MQDAWVWSAGESFVLQPREEGAGWVRTMHLYTRNKQSKNDMKETIPFTIASKRIKCLGINLTKELQDLKDCNLPNNAEREVKEALNEWRNSPCSWTGRLNIAKMAILYKLINKSNVIPIKSH